MQTIILDPHLPHREAGLRWLDRLASATGKQVLSAAGFNHQPRHLLEAQRRHLYQDRPVTFDSHCNS